MPHDPTIPRMDVTHRNLQYQLEVLGYQKVFDTYYGLLAKGEMSIDEFIESHLNSISKECGWSVVEIMVQLASEADTFDNTTDVMFEMLKYMHGNLAFHGEVPE